jgi:hypothetical protein
MLWRFFFLNYNRETMKKAVFAVLIGIILVGGLGGVAGAQAPSCQAYCDQVNTQVQKARSEGKTGEQISQIVSGIPKVPNTTCVCNPLQTANFTSIISNILTLLFNFALVLTPIMVVVAGIMFVTATGDPAKISKAKQMLIWTFVGFVIILLSRGLIAVLQAIIGF